MTRFDDAVQASLAPELSSCTAPAVSYLLQRAPPGLKTTHRQLGDAAPGRLLELRYKIGRFCRTSRLSTDPD